MKRKTWPSSHASIRRHIFAGVVIVAFLAIGVGGWAPGMPVEAFIQTGDRTMMSYFIKPLHDQLMRSFREK